MNELDLQSKYLIDFLCQRQDGLKYREAQSNTVSPNFFVVEDLQYFIRDTTLNKRNYRNLLKKFDSENELIQAFMDFLEQRIKEAVNMAIFIHRNQSVTFKGIKIHLFYPSGSVTHEDKLFDENVFSVVQELPYTFKYEGKKRFSFRPDLTFFLNGIYLGYSELKSNYNNQSARKNGRRKVAKDYLQAAREYLDIAKHNDDTQTIRKDFLKIFEKAIHITCTDVQETYIIRNIRSHFDGIRNGYKAPEFYEEEYYKGTNKDFKPYPLRNPTADKSARFEEVFKALYGKKMIEKEILYYNFIERELIKKGNSKSKQYKHNDGRLIAPRPKQKFGADKILDKIDEFLAHEHEPDYFTKKLRQELKIKGVGEKTAEELIAKREKFQNNKHVYSLLLQYAAGFGKSNIIGWTALQLKDLRKGGTYVYDKVMLVVDRVQLRDQLDTKMFNMNISNKMFIEADDKKSFLHALESDIRIVVVNVQKFTTIRDVLSDDIIQQLAALRIAFLIDEIHRSNSGIQHEEMVTLFDELQNNFDRNTAYVKQQTKKNLIIGFTATPSDHTLARFGEFSRYAENRPIWVPFDYYTMREAIEDGYILNPLKGIVPVSAKMYFEVPESDIEGFEGDQGYETIPDNTDTGVDANGKKYSIRKKRIYQNADRIKAISKFVVERLVSTVFHQIKGTAKAMLAVSSIPAAISYKGFIDQYFAEITQNKKYERFKDAPIYIVYSESQYHRTPASLNDGLGEAKVLQNFALKKNGLIIVVDKLQTGFDEPRLHTLFLDKEIRGIGAIQTISRVNRTMPPGRKKHDCKIIDFSYKNVNVSNIKSAFEHFSNVVVSDFDPLKDEETLEASYQLLSKDAIFEENFERFTAYQQEKADFDTIQDIQKRIESFINGQPQKAKQLKTSVNQYFKILNLIEFVLDLDKKYSEKIFLEFWRRFNVHYNILNPSDQIVDDVEIYFDNRIGIISKEEKPAKDVKAAVKKSEEGSGKQYRFDILKVIEKRNQEEEEIEALIQDFENKITQFFAYVKEDDIGKRLIAKMEDKGTTFGAEEIYDDFAKLYRKFVRRNKSSLGVFFIREMQHLTNQLCDEFERDQVARGVSVEAKGHLFIGTDDYLTAEAIYFAYRNFAESCGFKIVEAGTFVKGSWIRKGIRMTQEFFKRDEVKEAYRKAKRALELAKLEKVQAEIDGLKVNAGAALLESVKNESDIAVKLGSIMLVKTTVDGKGKTLLFDLTDEQLQTLNSNNELLNRPNELLKYLNQ